MGPKETGTLTYTVPEQDPEWALCVAELAKVVGEAEAKKPGWLRRLALSGDGRPMILITHAPWLSAADPCREVVWERSALSGVDPLATETRAHGIAAGVALLQSPENPELEIARRRELMQAKRDRDRAAVDALALPAERERKRESELSELRSRYGLDDWKAADPATKALYRLAHLLGSKYPDLDAAIRESLAVVERESAEVSLPRTTWWARPSAEELAGHFPPKE